MTPTTTLTTTPTIRHTIRRAIGPTAMAAAMLASAVALTAPVPSAEASAGSLATARYRVTYGDVPIGHVEAAVRVDPAGGYGIVSNFSSGGVARLMRETVGEVRATGSLGATAPAPSSFNLAYSQGEKHRQRALGFAGGGVSSVDVRPVKPVPNPATAAQLHGAIDPASALLVRAPDNGAAVCNRTLPIFDGTVRLDVTMAHRTTKRFRAKGWRGNVHECAAVLNPVAGAKPKSERTMRELRGTTVSFAPIPGTDAWMAVEVTVPSSYGTVRAKATRVGFDG